VMPLLICSSFWYFLSYAMPASAREIASVEWFLSVDHQQFSACMFFLYRIFHLIMNWGHTRWVVAKFAKSTLELVVNPKVPPRPKLSVISTTVTPEAGTPEHGTPEIVEEELPYIASISPIQLSDELSNLRTIIHSNSLKKHRMKCSQNPPEKVTLDQALSDIVSFEHFMRWLCKEFAGENLFSLIEMVQFKKRIFENERYRFRHPVPENVHLHHLIPDECPRSRIVYGDENGDYKAMARALYMKYVRDDVETLYEINLRCETRRVLAGLMEDEEEWAANGEYDDMEKLYNLFDDCIVAMHQLLGPAYRRFINSSNFKLIQVHHLKGTKSPSGKRDTPTTPYSQSSASSPF